MLRASSGTCRLIGGAMITVGGIVAVADISWWISGQERGHFPEWLESVSTLALVVGAAVAAIYAAQALGVEQARDLERHEEEKRAQAILIYAFAERDEYDRVFLRVRNGSWTVVTNVSATAEIGEVKGFWGSPVLEPTDTADRFFFYDGNYGEDLSRETVRLNTLPVVNLTFRDAAGRYWWSSAGSPPVVMKDAPDGMG